MLKNIFPIPIWKNSLNISDEVKDDILNQILNNYQKHNNFLHPSWGCRVHSTISEFNEINYEHVIPLFKNEYEIFSEENNLNFHNYNIREIWYNYYTEGYNQEVHNHIGSNDDLYSAVFFLKLNSQHPKITFHNPSYSYLCYSSNKKIESLYRRELLQHSSCFQQHTLNVEENDFIIFPSYLNHEVYMQTIKDPRITISMNIKIEM